MSTLLLSGSDVKRLLTPLVRIAAVEAYKAFDRRESGWVKWSSSRRAKERKAA
jgi:hypothetical protein